MEFIWSCMILALKVTLGGFFWAISFFVFSLGIALLAFFITGQHKSKLSKPKYQGKPIIVKGGKKDAK